MKLAVGASVAVAATLLLGGCEDQHSHHGDGYGAYPGGGYAGYPGGWYGGDTYDSYDDWRHHDGHAYGCDGGGCPYHYSDRRDGCDWDECRDPDRRPVVVYDRSRRQYVHVFVPRSRYGDDDRGSAHDNDRSGHQDSGWGRTDRDDAQRHSVEQRRDDHRGFGDEDARRHQHDADEQVFRHSGDGNAREQHQGQGRDADQDRGRADRSGSQERGQDRTDQHDRGGRDQNQHCGPGRGCSG